MYLLGVGAVLLPEIGAAARVARHTPIAELVNTGVDSFVWFGHGSHNLFQAFVAEGLVAFRAEHCASVGQTVVLGDMRFKLVSGESSLVLVVSNQVAENGLNFGVNCLFSNNIHFEHAEIG